MLNKSQLLLFSKEAEGREIALCDEQGHGEGEGRNAENRVCASTCHVFAYSILSPSVERRDYYLCGKDEQTEAQGNCANLLKVTQLISHRAWAYTLAYLTSE